MQKIRVGVVRGGPSSEYSISLQTGMNVLSSLDTQKYAPIDVMLSEKGEWSMNGFSANPEKVATHVDVVWNALHGTYGEDGKIQKLFEDFGIPYTGSNVLASAMGMHKDLAKQRFVEAGLLAPRGRVFSPDDDPNQAAFELIRDSHMPLIVKPVSGGSSVATTIVRTFKELEDAIRAASAYSDVLVEEVIDGKEATVCVIDGARSGEYFVLYPIEIVPPEASKFFDYDAKYSGRTQEICPGRFTLSTHSELRHLAIKAHNAIGARHYSRTDFIISPKGIFVLEINTLPGLTAESLLPKALKASNIQFPEFLDHVIGLTLAGK